MVPHQETFDGSNTMTHLVKTALLISLLMALPTGDSVAQEPSATRYYMIGNSLTWDAVPELLSGDIQWHVDCGTNLPFVYSNPQKPCVKSSVLWTTALREKQFDFVSVQPHYGSTLAQDVETISAWMKLQPKAVFVIHSGWAKHVQHADEFASYAPPEQMTHSPGYFRALLAELRRLHPGRELRQTLAHHLLAKIAEDIDAKQAPFEKLADLYRDDIHMKHESGKYLMHNAVRHALGQPFSTTGFEKMNAQVRQYLNGVLALLTTASADRILLTQLLSIEQSVDRSALIAKISDKKLRSSISTLLPDIERATKKRRLTHTLEAEIRSLGGKSIISTPSGPHWLYLATADTGMELFDTPAAIDLYDGNNPNHGKGKRNDRVTDAWLERLAGLTTLRRLDLANCGIHGEGLRHVSALTSLRELNLTLTPVKDDALKHVGSLRDLRMLGLASTQCNGTGFVHLKALQKLENVNFHFTPLNDAGLRAISQVPISGRLWFAHTHFTDEGSASLAAMTQLKRCGIGSMEKASSGESVAALAKLFLEDLALLDNQATPSGVAHAAKIATLRRLDISHAPTVGNDSLSLLARMPLLEELKIGSAQLTNDGIQVLAGAKSLKKLSLSGMRKITPAGVERLRLARPELSIEVR